MGYREDNSKEKSELSEKELNLARNAWNILRNFRTIPGLNEKGYIDEQELNSWVSTLLNLAKECNRLSIVQN